MFGNKKKEICIKFKTGKLGFASLAIYLVKGGHGIDRGPPL